MKKEARRRSSTGKTAETTMETNRHRRTRRKTASAATDPTASAPDPAASAPDPTASARIRRRLRIRRPLRIRRRPLRIRRRPLRIRRRPLRIRRRPLGTSTPPRRRKITSSRGRRDPSPSDRLSSSDPSPSSSDPFPRPRIGENLRPRRIRLRLRLRPRPLLPSPWVLRRSKPDARRRRPPSGSNPGRRPRGASPRRPPLRVRGTSTRSACLRRRRSACFRADGKPSVASPSRRARIVFRRRGFPGSSISSSGVKTGCSARFITCADITGWRWRPRPGTRPARARTRASKAPHGFWSRLSRRSSERRHHGKKSRGFRGGSKRGRARAPPPSVSRVRTTVDVRSPGRAPRIVGARRGDGELRATGNGLKPLGVKTWGPFVFLHLGGAVDGEERRPRRNPSPSPPEPIDDAFRAAGLREEDYASLAHVATRTYAMDCNWKVFCDNYLDGGYHVPFAHPALASGVAMRSYETEIYGLISVQRVRARLDDESDEARVEDVDVAGSKSADAPVTRSILRRLVAT